MDWSGDGDRQRFGLEPLALAGRAGARCHVALDLCRDCSRWWSPVAPLQVGDDALVVGLVGALYALRWLR